MQKSFFFSNYSQRGENKKKLVRANHKNGKEWELKISLTIFLAYAILPGTVSWGDFGYPDIGGD